ncbi:MAG: hypothetical protein EOP02_06620 [Proteobacteria bacterium]|nr:MAG: hypothetical protein EOP02_06620 [Pseudomonadota bacterium]
MGTLYLMRHGQASLGAADYDQLSELGHRQDVRLSEHWREPGMRFDALVTGTLRRHGQTWDGIAEGLALSTCDAQPWLGLAWLGLAWLGLAWLGLAWLQRIRQRRRQAGLFQKFDMPEFHRHYFRLLRDGLGRCKKSWHYKARLLPWRPGPEPRPLPAQLATTSWPLHQLPDGP